MPQTDGLAAEQRVRPKTLPCTSDPADEHPQLQLNAQLQYRQGRCDQPPSHGGHSLGRQHHDAPPPT
eukprot:6178561-Pleurochrysis_carterae.AAC.1